MVECLLAKENVEGSNPFSRSILLAAPRGSFFFAVILDLVVLEVVDERRSFGFTGMPDREIVPTPRPDPVGSGDA